MKFIEKNEEILFNYQDTEEFAYGSREFRRQQFQEIIAPFSCKCSECSLEGEALEENERMRAEIREKLAEIQQLLDIEGLPSRKTVKKSMKLSQQRLNLVQRLGIRSRFVEELLNFYDAAFLAKTMGIPTASDAKIFKQEALKYAMMFGDSYIHFYNKKQQGDQEMENFFNI